MILLTRGFLPLLEIGLLIYALIECIQTPNELVRNLPKWGWVVLIVFIPLIGSITWFFAGRPRFDQYGQPIGYGYPGEHHHGAPRVVGPDDDPEFLAQLKQIDVEHEETLRRWEEDLRKREEKLRDEGEPPTNS